jgi:hypothetical protein
MLVVVEERLGGKELIDGFLGLNPMTASKLLDCQLMLARNLIVPS